MVSQEPAKLSTVLNGVWVRIPVPPPKVSDNLKLSEGKKITAVG